MIRTAKRQPTALVLLVALACNRDAPPAPQDASTPTPVERPTEPGGKAPPVRKDNTIYGESELMGTRVSINVWVADRADAAKAGAAMQAALAEMARIESIMSEWQPHTELSRLSARAGGEPVRLSPELFEVLERSVAIASMTNGAFDPTFHGVGQLWSFRPGAKPPSKDAVARKLPLIDWRALELDPKEKTARLAKPGMMLGLGAIAKGYAVDRASQVLKNAGFEHHVVEAGGDTYASGTKGGEPWRVGVQHPDGKSVLGILHASNIAVVTSGDYQRFFEHEGVRYSHILDPKTGWPLPADRSSQSVTLVASDATTADALCTALAVMGPPAAMKFVAAHDGIEAIIVDAVGEVHVSDGLGEMYEPVAK